MGTIAINGLEYEISPDEEHHILQLVAGKTAKTYKGIDASLVELLRAINNVDDWRELIKDDAAFAVVCVMSFLEGYEVYEAISVIEGEYTLESIVESGPYFQAEIGAILHAIDNEER